MLAEELHFGRAAKRLAMTQPPLSIALRSLEAELGLPLFERTRRRVVLTHAGAVFLEEARGVLARVELAIEQVRAADRGEVGRLTVGFMAATAYTLLPLVLRDFAARFPMVRLDLRELTLPQQYEALRRGDIQVGLVRPPVQDPQLESEVILDEPLVLALPAGHRLSSTTRVRTRQLAGEPFIMFQRAPGLVLHDLVMRFCLGAGLTPTVVQEASQTHVVVGLVSAGIGVAIVPQSAQNIHLRGVVYRPLSEPTPPAGTALAWLRGDRSPVLRSFRDIARSVGKHYVALPRRGR